MVYLLAALWQGWCPHVLHVLGDGPLGQLRPEGRHLAVHVDVLLPGLNLINFLHL
jgi:hypothetical protein